MYQGAMQRRELRLILADRLKPEEAKHVSLSLHPPKAS
jgi:hypothetical protein